MRVILLLLILTSVLKVSLSATPRPFQYKQQQFLQDQQLKDKQEKEQEQELEEEEPDRLSLLLPQSKFNCGGKQLGYYADEGLQCEVFHYCDSTGARHSWLCPEGFTFHQVHLICMPPSHENICSQSANFHFVNEFLYRPLNAQEHLQKPNVTLRYAQRYFPETYAEEEYEEEERQPQRQPQSQQYLHKQKQQPLPHKQQQKQQVFHSPEEVNISLQQRRPNVLFQQQLPQFNYE